MKNQIKRRYGERLYVAFVSFLFLVYSVLPVTPSAFAEVALTDPLNEPITPEVSVETVVNNTETTLSTDTNNQETTSSFLADTNPLSSAATTIPLEITGVTTGSGNTYEWQNGVNTGELLYTDRAYSIGTYPSHLQDEIHLKTANDDKFATSENFLNFEVNQDVTVYVAYDINATSLPNWMSDWSTEGEIFGAGGGSHILYHKDFNFGTVTLGGNKAPGAQAAASNYTVVVVPKGTITEPEPAPPVEPLADSFLMSNGQLVIDAENMLANTPGSKDSWIFEDTLADFSGTGYFKSGPDNGTKYESYQVANSPHLEYNFFTDAPGTYYVWVRGYKTNNYNDSVHIGLDGVAPNSSNRIDGFTSNQFAWSHSTMDGHIATIEVTEAGNHTLDVWMREDGFALDKVMITSDVNFIPTGQGPAESLKPGAPAPDPEPEPDPTPDPEPEPDPDPTPITDGTFLMQNGLLVMESENFISNTAGTSDSWNLNSSLANASGTSYLVAGPNNGSKLEINQTSGSPHLEYRFHTEEPGTYYVWVRGHGNTIYDDSLHVGLDGTALNSSNRLDGFNLGSFSWANSTMDGPRATIEITEAGEHVLDLWMREDGFAFDKILLTKDPTLTVSGMGPAESNRYGVIVSNPDPTEYDKTGVAWETLEWTIENPTFSGNAYDVTATATFVHADTGETRTTEMFYAENGTWKFRFPSSRAGIWNFTTASTDPELDGLAGEVTIAPNPDGIGFLGSVGNKFAREVGDQGAKEGFILNVYQNFHNISGLLGDFANPIVLQNYIDEVKANGMNAMSFVVNNNWFQLGAETYSEHNSTTPDPATFALLETIINTAHAQGVHVHMWMWGDEERQWTPVGVPGGINGAVDQRLQKYIAARLGPLPGWSIGYGFDLIEWVTESELQVWADNIENLAGWDHLLMARERTNASLDASSLPGFGPDTYFDTVNDMDLNPGRPTLYAERFMYNRWGKYDMTTTRRTLWRNALAGGAGAWFGFFSSQFESFYPAPGQLRNYRDFWDGRFLLDFERANSLTNGFALKNQTNDAFVFYKEDTTSIQLDLSAATSSLPAFAIDTKGNYLEVDLGLLLAENQTWTAPYSSDWVLAVGTIAGALPVPTNVYSNTSVLTFDGTNQHLVEVHDNALLLDEGSLKVRFKTDVLGVEQALVSKDASGFGTGGHFTVWIGADNKIHARLGSATEDHAIVSTTSVTIDTTTEVTFTFGARGLELFVNGTLEATGAFTGGLGTSSGGVGNLEPMVLGAASWNSTDLSASPLEAYLNGMIELVELHNTQLTA